MLFLDLDQVDKANERNQSQCCNTQPVVQYDAYSGQRQNEAEIARMLGEAVNGLALVHDVVM